MQLGIPLSGLTSVRRARPCHGMPMPILDEITQPDPAGTEEVLNRNDYHTLDAKDHGDRCRISVTRVIFGLFAEWLLFP